MTEEDIKSSQHESEADDLLQKKEFGSELRKAREKAGLSISEVAEKLLISPDVIKAIENSQAEALPSMTFAQGYIRSYARLLDLSADEIIKTYIQVAPNSKQVLTPNSILPAQKSSNDSSVKVISFAFLVTGIFVLFFWLYQTDFSLGLNKQKKTLELNNTQSSVSDENNSLSIKMSEESGGLLIEEEIEMSGPDRSVTNEQFESIEIVTEQETIPEQVEVIKRDILVLTATGESWCEIQDAEGNRLYYQLLGVDEEVKLEGISPFEVFLGNAPKVRIEINNKIVDFEHLINANSNIANLKIESDSEVISSKNR